MIKYLSQGSCGDIFVAKNGEWSLLSRSVGDRAQQGVANGEAVVPIVVVGRIDGAGAVEVEVVGAGAVIARSRRPVVAVVAGVGEQVAILIDEAAPTERVRRI